MCVQPTEPDHGSAPPPPPTEAPANEEQPKTRTKPKNRRLRLWIAVAAGVISLLCLGGVGVAVLLYDKETKIDRAEPDAVVDRFLAAYFVNEDDKQAELYLCEAPNLAELASYRENIADTERRFSVGIRVTWRNFNVQPSGNEAVVDVDLVRTISDGSEETSDRWQFGLKADGGWRVCAANPVT